MSQQAKKECYAKAEFSHHVLDRTFARRWRCQVQCTVRFRQEAQGVTVDQWCDIVWVRVTQWSGLPGPMRSIDPKSHVTMGLI